MADNLFLEVNGDELDKFVASLRPAKPVKFDYDKRKYVYSDDVNDISTYDVCGRTSIEALKNVISAGRDITANFYSLCFYLQSLRMGYKYIANPDRDWGNGLVEGYELCDFESLMERLGLSKSTFYRYCDLGRFVDVKNNSFIPELHGYSVSLVNEMITIARMRSSWFGKENFINLTKVIPATTTVEQIKQYKKIFALREKCKPPFAYSSDKNSMYQRIQYDTKLVDVLNIWKEWEEGEANKQLEETMSGKTVTNDPTPEFDETIKSLREEIDKLKLGYVPELGMCEGCKYKGTNLNKCRSCRRYKDMKDLYEGV